MEMQSSRWRIRPTWESLHAVGDLLRLLASSMGVRRWFLHTPPRVGLALTGLVGLLMRDMALTRDEVVGLMVAYFLSDY